MAKTPASAVPFLHSQFSRPTKQGILKLDLAGLDFGTCCIANNRRAQVLAFLWAPT